MLLMLLLLLLLLLHPSVVGPGHVIVGGVGQTAPVRGAQGIGGEGTRGA